MTLDIYKGAREALYNPDIYVFLVFLTTTFLSLSTQEIGVDIIFFNSFFYASKYTMEP